MKSRFREITSKATQESYVRSRSSYTESNTGRSPLADELDADVHATFYPPYIGERR